MRNLLTVPKTPQPAMAALVRTIFVQPDLADCKRQFGRVVETLWSRYPKAPDLLASAEEDILVHLRFPEAHGRRLHSTHPLERLHKGIKRRPNVVGIFPNRAAGLRLVRALLMGPVGAGRRVQSAGVKAGREFDPVRPVWN